MQNISKILPDLKFFGLWLTIWPEERGELLYLENVDFASPFLAYYFSNVSENSMMRNRKITAAMLSPSFTPTLNGIDVSIFPIISLTTLIYTFF